MPYTSTILVVVLILSHSNRLVTSSGRFILHTFRLKENWSYQLIVSPKNACVLQLD